MSDLRQDHIGHITWYRTRQPGLFPLTELLPSYDLAEFIPQIDRSYFHQSSYVGPASVRGIGFLNDRSDQLVTALINICPDVEQDFLGPFGNGRSGIDLDL